MAHTVSPRHRIVEQKLNERFTSLYDPNLFLAFDECVPENVEFRLQERRTNIEIGYTTINEERAKEGLDPVPWGDEPMNRMPAMMSFSAESGEDAEEEEPIKSVKKKAQTGAEKRAKAWHAYIKAIKPVEDEFKRKVSGLFKEQKAEVLSKIDEPTLADHAAQAAVWMFGRKQWEKRFRDVGRQLIKTAAFVNGKRLLEEMPGISVTFDIDNPRAVAWIKRKVFKFSYEVNETTERQLRSALVDALDSGASIREITARVKEIFDHAESYRNEAIARTETISATNYGAYEAIKQSGLAAKKEWISTIDDRTRESHADMDGETVGLDESFSNGLRFPGDPDGPAEEVINCRCTIGHIFPEDEEWSS